MLPWLTRASLIRHIEDDSGGIADWSTRLLYPEQKEPGKFTFNRELEGFDLVWKLLKSTHAKAVQKIVESCSYVRIARSFSQEGETPLIMAVLERHDWFGIVSCRKLKWLLVSRTGGPKSCEKKSQLTFRYQVSDYSSIENIDYFDNLIGAGVAP
jgi:hypothetical protein